MTHFKSDFIGKKCSNIVLIDWWNSVPGIYKKYTSRN
jgi:hypothetical protein